MTFAKLTSLREKYCISYYIELIVLKAHERAYYLMLGCVAVGEFLFKVGMHLPLYPLFMTVL